MSDVKDRVDKAAVDLGVSAERIHDSYHSTDFAHS